MFSFAFARLFNAGTLLIATILSALIVGADKWSVAAIMQTIFSYLVFINLGINEGLGQRIVRKARLYISTFYFFQVVFIFLSITPLLLYFLFHKSSPTFLLLLSGTSALLLFSLMRLYFRGTANLKGLGVLYIFNAVFMMVSPLLVYLFNDPLIYIYTFILASPISTLLTSYILNDNIKSNFLLHFKFKFKSLYKKVRVLIHVGSPIMLAGLVFELIITIDRFYIKNVYSNELVGNIGLSLMIVKGAIMLLSILNTVSFKTLSVQVSLKDYYQIKKLYKKQVSIGLICMLMFILCIYFIIATPYFSQFFPSYSDLSSIFIFQSFILIPLSVLFPLSVISNFRFGGKVYLCSLIGVLFIYVSLSFSYHFFIGFMTIKNLSIFVSFSFCIGVLLLHYFVFRKGTFN